MNKKHMQRWLKWKAEEIQNLPFKISHSEAERNAVQCFNNLNNVELIEALELGRIWLEADALL